MRKFFCCCHFENSAELSVLFSELSSELFSVLFTEIPRIWDLSSGAGDSSYTATLLHCYTATLHLSLQRFQPGDAGVGAVPGAGESAVPGAGESAVPGEPTVSGAGESAIPGSGEPGPGPCVPGTGEQQGELII